MKKSKPKTLIATLIAIVMFLIPVIALASDPPAPIAKTGQTTSYQTGDDGDYEKGVDWPDPRFTDNGDGTVTDNLTGLMWAKDANWLGEYKTWNDAIDYANNLSLGSDGCGTSYTDWRLPNVNELESLRDLGKHNPAQPSGHPFLNMVSIFYWTSTAVNGNSEAWWAVDFRDGTAGGRLWSDKAWVWPVRGNALPDSPAPVAKTGQTTSYITGDEGEL